MTDPRIIDTTEVKPVTFPPEALPATDWLVHWYFPRIARGGTSTVLARSPSEAAAIVRENMGDDFTMVRVELKP